MPVESIVVAGLAVEAPGGIDRPAALWSALAGSADKIGPFPRDRGWPVDAMLALAALPDWGPIQDAGGFLTSAAEFDPLWFGVSPREAIAMDPQQRVALRVAWRALESAGINPGTLAGAEVGCYIGASAMEYGPRLAEVNEHNGHRVNGAALSAVSGRIAHALGLAGPALTVDAACASALAALHTAVQAVRAGDCAWALAGAVCVMGSPAAFYEFAKNNALSADGRCRAYADDASGTVWGEGAAVLVIEPERRAIELGHRIHARIAGSRINHNGGGRPLIVPSAEAQERLIRATIDTAGVDPADVAMIEGHGTATPTGDPLELTALQNTYGTGGSPLLGSVKSNLGHAQAASGALGLAKVLLAGRHATIPATLFADRPTSKVDWGRSTLRLATEPTSWPAVDGQRYAAVSSMGAAGTNAHVILAMPDWENADA